MQLIVTKRPDAKELVDKYLQWHPQHDDLTTLRQLLERYSTMLQAVESHIVTDLQRMVNAGNYAEGRRLRRLVHHVRDFARKTGG